jgi:hypothetical protein
VFVGIVGFGAGSAVGGVATPWANQVIAYDSGTGVDARYTDASTALGSPTRANFFGDAVTPFNSAYWFTDVVTIGQGGSLTVAFGEAVTDDVLNPFGIDLLIFGNQFYITDAEGRITSTFNEGGVIELSADGVNWSFVTHTGAEGGFPTLGFTGIADLQFGGDYGTGLTDFTRPVDPSLNPMGLSREALAAAYGTSGGGLGIDIGALGFSEISFVRVSNSRDAAGSPDIDAFADVSAVPGPGGIGVVTALVLSAALRRRSR